MIWLKISSKSVKNWLRNLTMSLFWGIVNAYFVIFCCLVASLRKNAHSHLRPHVAKKADAEATDEWIQTNRWRGYIWEGNLILHPLSMYRVGNMYGNRFPMRLSLLAGKLKFWNLVLNAKFNELTGSENQIKIS